MSVVGPELEFASRNPDYWWLLVPGGEPDQVALLDERRKRAFDAARAEVQGKVASLIRAGHAALQHTARERAMAGGPDLAVVFSRTPNLTSLGKGSAYWKILEGRGRSSWLNLYFGAGTSGRVALYLVVETAKERMQALEGAFSEALGADGFDITSDGYIGVHEDLDQDREIVAVANSLVERGWPSIEKFVAAVGAQTGVGGEDD